MSAPAGRWARVRHVSTVVVWFGMTWQRRLVHVGDARLRETTVDHDDLDPGTDAPAPGSHIDRRKLIVGGAVGGAAVWAAPSVLSMSAAAAATDQGGGPILPPSPGTGPYGISPIPYTALTLDNPTTIIAGQQDDATSTFTLPWNFRFYGVDYGFVVVGVNGFLGPGGSGVGFSNDPLAAGPPLIAPYWDDLALPTGSAVSAQAFGTAPNRYVVFRWQALRHYGNFTPPGPFIFDVVLYETAQIDFIYTNVVETDSTALFDGPGANVGVTAADVSNGNLATIGVQGPSGFTQWTFNGGGVGSLGPTPDPVTSLSALRIVG